MKKQGLISLGSGFIGAFMCVMLLGFTNPSFNPDTSLWGEVELNCGVFPLFNCATTKGLAPILAHTDNTSEATVLTQGKYVIFPNGFDRSLIDGSMGNGDIVFRNNNLIRWMIGNGNTSYNYVGSLTDSNMNLGTTNGQRVNMLWNDVELLQFINQSGGVHMKWDGLTFANLGTPVDGTMTYCSDCNATCAAGASTGQFCKRLAGAWGAM